MTELQFEALFITLLIYDAYNITFVEKGPLHQFFNWAPQFLIPDLTVHAEKTLKNGNKTISPYSMMNQFLGTARNILVVSRIRGLSNIFDGFATLYVATINKDKVGNLMVNTAVVF